MICYHCLASLLPAYCFVQNNAGVFSVLTVSFKHLPSQFPEWFPQTTKVILVSLVNTFHSSAGQRESTLKNNSIVLACGQVCGDIFLPNDWREKAQPIVAGIIFGQVIPDYLRRQAGWQATGCEPASNTPRWPFLHCLPLGSCLEFPTLT